MARLKPNQETILDVMGSLGGRASIKQIVEVAVGLNVNGVSQSLGALLVRGYVRFVSGTGKDSVWRLSQTIKVI